MVSTIAIDGPVGAGKSVVGKCLADRLGFRYLDTGVLYRAVTWAVLERGIPLEHETQLAQVAQQLSIDVQRADRDDGRQATILCDGKDVTWAIRAPEVERHVSQVSQYAAVRDALLDKQRQIGKAGRIVMVGRDIGTVVLPDADLKIFLTASAEERARRRWLELERRGQPVSYDRVLADLLHRDEIDSQRAVAPLRPAKDAIVIVTDHLSVEQITDRLEQLARKDP